MIQNPPCYVLSTTANLNMAPIVPALLNPPSALLVMPRETAIAYGLRVLVTWRLTS